MPIVGIEVFVLSFLPWNKLHLQILQEFTTFNQGRNNLSEVGGDQWLGNIYVQKVERDQCHKCNKRSSEAVLEDHNLLPELTNEGGANEQFCVLPELSKCLQ